jgi:cytochrome o ubiquinol oxidase subunit 3
MMDAAIGSLTVPVAAGIPISERGPASTRTVVSFGFWLFLLSDIVIFSALFAAYAVLSKQTAGGPAGLQLFDLRHVFIETFCLLISSFTCGLCLLAVERRAANRIYVWSIVTFLLGASFVSLEVSEFADMIVHGAGPTRSAFLSAFFALVGTHGIHVTVGLCWLAIMMLQVATIGLRPMVVRRFWCFSLFWHALDLVWIGVFTIVYLGARA